MSKWMIYTLMALILLLGAFFRFYGITEIPPGLYPDEAMNGNNALEVIATSDFKWFYPENNGREGFFINLQAISIWIFGNKPWALRVVSALFGTLTILGVYLLTKELFSTKSQIQSTKSQTPVVEHSALTTGQANPNDRNSKLFGIWNLKFGISRGQYIGLLSSFFLATSYWHINFSRIGFRAIMVPFFAIFGLYFLLKGLRTKKISSLVAAGVFIGLGFHTYIAFRFIPFVIMVPILFVLTRWWRERKNREDSLQTTNYKLQTKSCAPCAIALFLFITFVVALPIGYYFLQHPEDFMGRGGQVSIFTADSPLYEFAKSNLLTMQMFFWRGDCNWRHNFNCQPELHPLVALFFVIGIITAIWHLKNPKSLPADATHQALQAGEIRNLYPPKFSSKTWEGEQIPNRNEPNSKRFNIWNFKNWNLFGIWNLEFGILLAWLAFMSLPATLTHEGVPHALRTIGMIPPVMILAGLGAWRTIAWILGWLERKKEKWPQNFGQIIRIQLELTLLFVLILLWIPNTTFKDYFFRWASHSETYFHFATDTLHLGQYLNGLPQDIQKYIVVNMSAVEVRGIPMPAQTVMFTTDTFREKSQREKNIYYILPYEIEKLTLSKNKKTVIALLDGNDREIKKKLEIKFPNMEFKAPGDFVIFTNTN